MPRVTSQRPRGSDGRNGEDQNENQIDDEKSTAAVLPHHVWKPPDVAETDGDADHGQDGCETCAEEFPCFHLLFFRSAAAVSVCGGQVKNNAGTEFG